MANKTDVVAQALRTESLVGETCKQTACAHSVYTLSYLYFNSAVIRAKKEKEKVP